MKKVLFLASTLDINLGLFSDLEDDEYTILHYVVTTKVNPVFSLFRRIHLSGRLNLLFKGLPLRHIWFDYGEKINLEEVKCIVVTNSCVDIINYKFLQKCKSKGVKINLIILDSLNADSYVVKKSRKYFFLPIWDDVFTFDLQDAKEYGFIYKGYCYYSRNEHYSFSGNCKYDIYFIGGTKGNRAKLINTTYKYFSDKGCKCIYDVKLKSKEGGKCEGINYLQKMMKYDDVLHRMGDCKCILEIVQEKQNGPSLRYFEAIFYNKKLITNNKNIVNYPYYNPKWMKIMETPEDIDIEWIKSSDSVDYHYKGEFSPVNFIKYVLKQ